MKINSKDVIAFILHNKLLAHFSFLFNVMYSNTSYSQEGEDLILDRIFQGKKSGFYIDIGAHHPVRFSNTYKLYRRGWRGINIDATPNSMNSFNIIRRKDINLELPISKSSTNLTFYIFNDPAINTFSSDSMKNYLKKGYKISKKIKLKTYALETILDNYLPKKVTIDFLSIDAEGMDYEIITSNNWRKYRPKILLIENEFQIGNKLLSSKISIYLKKQNYILIAKTYNTFFYLDEKQNNVYIK